MIKGFSIISPASGVMQYFPNRVEYGKKFLESQGFSVVFENNSFKNKSYYSASIQERVDDINQALDEKDTNIIMASIGGYNSNQLLSSLDYNKIANSHKVFCGYSDITSLILAIHSKTRKIVFHGPTFVPEICEYPKPFDYTWDCFVNVANHKTFEYKEPDYEVKEFVDWNEQENKFIERKKEKNSQHWNISKNGIAQGKLIGGNLSTILTIIGTEYLPLEMFNDKIIFLEDVNISIAEFDSFMQSLKFRGIFNKVKGVIIGKFEDSKNNEEIGEFLAEFFEKYDCPIIYNVDLGHTNPQLTIPIGAEALLECKENDITFKIINY